MNELCWQQVFPFKSKFFSFKDSNGFKQTLHYVEEGEGAPLLCLHGNPTWSFYYRRIIAKFSKSYKVLALDHLGCGFSSKQPYFPYKLEDHIKNLESFCEYKKIEDVTLVVHDWGGAIGTGWALKNRKKVKKMIFLNTAAFLSKDIPTRISLCRIPWLGDFLIRYANAFALAATWMASAKKLAPEVKKGLLAPYTTAKNRTGISSFVHDIPLHEKHPSYHTLAKIEQGLKELTCPKLIIWGMKDFCFHEGFLNRWLDFFPDVKIHKLYDAGHYLLEDNPKDCINYMTQFMESR